VPPSSSMQPVLLLLADVGGYTRFMLEHRKAQEHGQIIIATLLDAILSQARAPVEVSRLEGDAVFMFARDGDGAREEIARALPERIGAFFGEFEAARDVLAGTAICRCSACANVGSLELKVIVHAGEAVLSSHAGRTDLHGVDVILAHRLLKNTVPVDEYLLLTDAALEAVPLADPAALERRVETYPDIGEVETWVLAGERVERSCPTCAHPGSSGLAHRIIRREVQGEYREVARHPDRGFHFHTGRDLARRLAYAAEDVDAVPAVALESFAGTGIPFSLGEIPVGARVVDVGCGSGFDTLIAARRVGDRGAVIGVDMTDDMARNARAAASEAGLANVAIALGYAESLPLPDGWAHVILSNGALNLCPDKPAVLAEWHRALAPGGRLQIADISVERPVPEEAKGDIDLWTG